MRPRTLIGAGCAVIALVPALAHAQGQQSFTAVDTPAPAWRANGTASTSVTITAGQAVGFASQGNQQPHFVEFSGSPKPTCTSGVQQEYRPPSNWSGTCTFDTPGVYQFKCPVHEIDSTRNMRGTVRVEAAATPTPTETASPSPTPTATPVAGGPPPPTVKPQTTLTLTLGQRGTRVRGTVVVEQGPSRIEVTLTTKLAGKARRVGRVVIPAARSGTRTFSVPLTVRGRRALRSRGRLSVKVAVALTPPGGSTVTRSRSVRLALK